MSDRWKFKMMLGDNSSYNYKNKTFKCEAEILACKNSKDLKIRLKITVM